MMKTTTLPVYVVNKTTEPQKKKTPITLKPCPLCGGNATLYPGRKIYNKPTLFIRCEKCQLRTASESFNTFICKEIGKGFHYYNEQEAIEDICKKWNNRVDQ